VVVYEAEKDSLGRGNEGDEGPNLDIERSMRGEDERGVDGAVDGRPSYEESEEGENDNLLSFLSVYRLEGGEMSVEDGLEGMGGDGWCVDGGRTRKDEREARMVCEGGMRLSSSSVCTLLSPLSPSM
jgi:hypothetical protein